MMNIPEILQINNADINVNKSQMRKLQELVDDGEVTRINFGQNPSITIGGAKEAIEETAIIVEKNDVGNFYSYENGTLVSNFSEEISENDNDNPQVFVCKSLNAVAPLCKFKLYFYDGTIFKYFPDENSDIIKISDFIALYLHTKSYYGLVLLNYTVDKIPTVFSTVTTDVKIGEAFKLLLADLFKMSIKINNIRREFHKLISLKTDETGESGEMS